jgi:hypothetical protein
MSKVTNYCNEFLEHYLAVDNCVAVRDLAEKYNYIEWDKMKLEFIYDHIDTETLYRESRACLYFVLKSLIDNNISIERYSDTFKELNKVMAQNKNKLIGDNVVLDDEMIVPNMDENDLLLPNSPIVVEPVEFVSITRSRSKAQNMKERASTSSSNIKSKLLT